MYKDPEMTWEGEFPYDALAPAGITPDSSISEIQQSMSYFTRRRQGGYAQKHWKSLRKVKDRLFVDFFLYRIKLSAEVKEDNSG